MKIFMLLLILGLSGCGGHLRVSNRGCAASFEKMGNGTEEIIYEEGVWHKNFDDNEKVVYVKNLLKEKGISCSELRSVSISVGQGFVASALSLIPFFRQTDVTIRGKFN